MENGTEILQKVLIMATPFLPIFVPSLTHISKDLAYKLEDGTVYYFNGHMMPVFSHSENDLKSFKMILAQFYINGYATQAEIIKAFGLPPIAMKRAVALYRLEGPGGFFINKRRNAKPRVLTPEVIMKVQSLLDEGLSTREIALQLGLKQNTLDRAIRNGQFKKKSQVIAR